MSDIQQGRAKARKIFKKPKTFAKSEKMYKEVFNDRNVQKEDNAEAAPKYSRVTHKLITKIKKK